MKTFIGISVTDETGDVRILEGAKAQVICRGGGVHRVKVIKKRELTARERTLLGKMKHGTSYRIVCLAVPDAMEFPVFHAELIAGPRSGEMQFGNISFMSFVYRGCSLAG